MSNLLLKLTLLQVDVEFYVMLCVPIIKMLREAKEENDRKAAEELSSQPLESYSSLFDKHQGKKIWMDMPCNPTEKIKNEVKCNPCGLSLIHISLYIVRRV